MSWPTVSLEEISESIVYGLNASATNDENGPRFLRITDIHESSVDWDTVPSCKCSEKELEKFRLSSGDIVFARTGATTGKSCLIRNCPTDSVFASYLIRVRLNEKANPEYISHFFQSPIYWAQVRSTAVGAAQPGINATKLKKMQIPLPPIEEQKRIAAILDKANQIKIISERTSQKRIEFLNAIFFDLFGDILTGNSTCEYAILNDCSKFIDYRGQSPPKSPQGIRLITAKNVKHGYLNYDPEEFIDEEQYDTWMSRGFPKLGDVLFTTEAPMGNAALWPDTFEKIAIAQRTICIRLDERIEPEYFLWLVLSDWFKLKLNRLATGSTAKGIKSSSLKKIEIPIPPKRKQEQFGALYNYYNNTNSKFELRLSESKQNILSIAQELLT
jgi:type I restriction enzyme, S subunit